MTESNTIADFVVMYSSARSKLLAVVRFSSLELTLRQGMKMMGRAFEKGDELVIRVIDLSSNLFTLVGLTSLHDHDLNAATN